MENNYNNDYSCEVRERSELCISCLLAGITAGVLVAIAVGLLFFFGVITNLTIALWVAFGVGIFTLVSTFAAALLTPVWISRKCFCRNKNALLTGGIGLVVTTVIALSTTLAAQSILSAILIGLVAFFLLLSLASIICFIICITRCR